MKSFVMWSLLTSVLAANAYGAQVSFTGGSCTFTDMSTSGPLIIKSCTNTRGVDATDLHVTVTLLNEKGGPVVLTSAPIDVEFPAISGNGGVYTFPPEFPFGNGHLIWKAATWQNKFEANDIPIWGETLFMEAHWTPPIPEPSVAALGLSGLLVMGALRLRKPTKESFGH